MKNKYYIYRHVRLDTNLPFYVGKGSNNRVYSKEGRNLHWHNIVNKVSYRIDFILKDLSEKEAFDKEKYFIKLYGRIDEMTGSLVNMTDGGEGRSGFKHSEKTKAKMSIASKGKKKSDEHKTAMKVAQSKQIINCRGEIFESAKVAAKAFGLKSYTGINMNLKGRDQSAGKYSDGIQIVWSYYKE